MPLWLSNSKSIFFAFIFCSLAIATKAHAKDVAVFDIRRPLSMENGQDLPKDYYINGGSETGLKAGMLVTVTRRLTMYDPFQNKSPGDLMIPVGRLRIIHVQDGLAVARLEDMLERVKLPNLDIDAVTIGDRLDLTTAKMSPPKTASLDAPADMVEQADSSSNSTNLNLPNQGPTL